MAPNMHEIPMNEESAEALDFIGFEPFTASEIFNNWMARPDPTNNCYSLMDYVDSHTAMLHQKHLGLRDMPHRQAMTKVGLKEDLQDAILDPRFEQIFRTENRSYWVRETLRTNLCALQQQQHLLRASRTSSPVANCSAINASPTWHESKGLAVQPTFTTNRPPADPDIPVKCYKIAPKISLTPNYVALYRGQAYDATQWEPYFTEQGAFAPGALCTRSRGTFDFEVSGWQFTPDKAVAEQYRQYAARRCPMSETWLVCIHVPKYFIRSLARTTFYHDSDEWMDYLWHPKHYHSPNHIDLVTTHISTAAGRRLEDVRATDPADWVFRNEVTNEVVDWYVFRSYDCIERLMKLVAGITHIEISTASRSLEQSKFQGESDVESDDWEFVDTDSWAPL